MRGVQLTFYTSQGRTHGTLAVADLILREARSLGIEGVTQQTASAGYGRDGIIRSTGFFDLARQTVLVIAVTDEKKARRLLARIAEEGLEVFYVMVPVEFGFTKA